MTWLDDVLANLQGGAAPAAFSPPPSPFPDIQPPPDEAAAAAAAREAAGARLIRANQPRINPFGMPDMNSAGVQLALGQGPAGTGVPVEGSPQFQPMGIPPSMQLASTMAAPSAPPPQSAPELPPPNQVPLPRPRPDDAPDETPTDLSAQSRAPAAPMGIPPAPSAPPEPSMMQRFAGGLGAVAPALLGVGAALQGDMGATTQKILKAQEDKALVAQSANMTGQALLKAGAPPELVSAAIRSPEMLKAAVAQYFGKDKFKVVQTGENDRGKKTFQLMNEQDGTFKKIPGAEVAADSATDAAAAAGITGEHFLATVPNAQDRSLIKQLTQYDLDPAKLSAKAGNRERLLALAEQYDPDYKAVLYAPRAAALKEFTSGGQTSPAAIITNGNTAIQHLGRMSELADRLGGTNKGWILNGAINWANVTIEDMKNNPDLARFKGAQDRFVEEATKFYRGVGGNKADIDRALHILTAAQSPEARQAAIQEQAELMKSKVNALQDRFKSAMGPSGWKKAISEAGTEFPIVQEKSGQELENIRKRASGEKVGGTVKPGNYVWKNGALVPE